MVVGTLATDYAMATVNVAEGQYSTIGAEMMAYADFNVTLDAAAPEDFVIPFTLDLVDANGRHTEVTFNYKNSCNVIFALHDSYGDGWNNAYLSVTYSDGTPAEQMTISTGNSANYTRELASGSNITLSWHSGNWDSECSFDITYEDGTVIYQNAGGFSGTQTFDVNCSGGGGIPEFCEPVRNLVYELDGHNVILTWDAPENGNPTGYEVYRETELLETVTVLTFTDLELAEGDYYYCVYAVYDDCQSEYVCALVEVSSCGPVQNLQYTLNDALLLTLTWEAPEDLTDFVEYQIFMDDEQVGTTNELTYAFTITPGDYDVAVKAVFAECEKDAHVQVCAVGAVENLEYLLASPGITFTWEALEGVNQYDVYIDDEWVTTRDFPRYQVFYEDLEGGHQTLTVKAVVAESCFAAGASVEFCPLNPIVTDAGCSEVDVNGQMIVVWDPVLNADYYEVECNGMVNQIVDTIFVFDAILGRNEISITAFSDDGCSSNTISVIRRVCDGVSGFDYSFNGNEVTITWEADGANGNKVVLNEVVFELWYQNSYSAYLENGAYSLYVKPYYGNEWCMDAFFARFDFHVTNIAPEIRFTDVREGHMMTAWNAVDGAIAYNLYRDGELIAEGLTETAYDDTEMAANMQHCYAVQSVFEKGISDISEAACANYFTGLDENDGKVNIFPNPTTDKVTVECNGMTQIDLYNMEGKLVRSLQVENDACQIDGLEKGIYMLRIRKGDETFVHRIVKM